MSGKIVTTLDIDRFLKQGSKAGTVEVRKNRVIKRKELSKDCHLELSRMTPVLDRCDILIVGGGPAGLSAAVSAKRCHKGLDVLIVDKSNCFGGVITNVGMESIAWYEYPGTEGSHITGIGKELERLASEAGATSVFPYNGATNLLTEPFKLVADKFLLDNGVRPLLETRVVGAIKDGRVILGVVTESIAGRHVIYAKRVIDCSGDAAVVHYCDARYTVLPESQRMGVTSVFHAKNVDRKRFLAYTGKVKATYNDWSRVWNQETSGAEDNLRTPYLDKEFEKAEQDGVIPEDLSLGGSWSTLTDQGELLNLNLVHMHGVDALDTKSVTESLIEGRRKTVEALKALSHSVPGCENIELRNFSSSLGVRDTRKVFGHYNLTGRDVLELKTFPDTVGTCPRFVDGYGILLLPLESQTFEVPYGCIRSADIDNLLVAGRCVAGDHVSHAAMRNMACCFVTGQAAGIAAGVSLLQNSSTDSVSVWHIQKELRKQGVRYRRTNWRSKL